MAARVLVLGERPATVRFDRLDRLIAENCAFWMADLIACRFVLQRATEDEDDDVCRKIAWLVYEAIEAYATYDAESERTCKSQLARAKERERAKGPGEESDIPF